MELLKLKFDSVVMKKTSGIYRFLAQNSNKIQINSTSSSESTITTTTTTTSITTTTSTSSILTSSTTFNKQYPKKAQEELLKHLDFVNHDLGGLYKRKLAGMLTEEEEKAYFHSFF